MTAGGTMIWALLVLTVAPPAVAALLRLRRRRASALPWRHEEAVLPADSDRPLTVRLERGVVSVATEPGLDEHRISADLALVERHSTAALAALELRVDAEDYCVSHQEGDGALARVELSLTLAPGTSVRIEGGEVHVLASGDLGGLVVELVAGHVRLDDLTLMGGTCRAKVGTGVLAAKALRAVGASVELSTGGGEVRFDGSARDLLVRTSIGGIALSLRGPCTYLSAISGAGPVIAEFADEAPSRAELLTKAGDITLALPLSSRAEFALHTGAGTIDAERRLGVEPIDCKESAAGATVSCRMGGGGAATTAYTEAGDITLMAHTAEARTHSGDPAPLPQVQPEHPPAEPSEPANGHE